MKQVRISDESHQKIKVYAAERKITVVEAIDSLINEKEGALKGMKDFSERKKK